MKSDAGSLGKGDFIIYQNDIWQIQKADFNFQGRGMANVRFKIKSATSQKNIDVTFKSNASVETADVDTVEMKYLYKDAENLYFMDEKTFQQYPVSIRLVGDFDRFLKEENKYYLVVCNEKALGIKKPASVKLKVVETENAVRGDTVSGAKKKAVIESGAVVMVPLFIKVGDVLAINPETGEYVERIRT